MPMTHPPGASRLYSLKPEGIETPLVESLTGYIARLAEAHSVTTGNLVVREVLPKVRRTRGVFAGQLPTIQRKAWIFLGTHILNGLCECPREWVNVVEDLTGHSDLKMLTALPWTGLLSHVGLLRTCLAWCPYCLEDQRANGSVIHEPLLWTLRSVSVCPFHSRPLVERCLDCGRWLYVFSAKSRPGYCSRCGKWLGQHLDAGEVHLPESGLAEQVWTAEAIGEMIAVNVHAPNIDIFRLNLRTCVERCARRSRRALKLASGCDIHEWIAGQNVPRMESLIRLCRPLRLSPVRLFMAAISPEDQMWDFAEERIRLELPKSHRAFPLKPDDAAEALEQALNGDLPMTLEKVAEGFGYRTKSRLRQLQPNLCAQLTQKLRTPSAKRTSADQVRRALEAGIAQESPPSLQEIAASLGLKGCTRLYRRFPKLCRVLMANNRGLKRQSSGLMKKTLTNALAENPPPRLDDLARRVGFHQAKPLWSRFPDLMQALKNRGIAARSRGIKVPVSGKPPARVPPETEAVFQAALLEEPAPPLKLVVARLPCHHNTSLRLAFPKLWTAIRERYLQKKKTEALERRNLLRQTVREIVADLSSRGIHPKVSLVQSILRHRSNDSFRSLDVICEAIREALAALST
jgi:hypothetical protein